MPSEVLRKFDQSLLEAARQCAQLGYKPTEFLRMVHERGGLETARSLLHSPSASSGFTRLWELQRLDLSLEAQILQPEWHALFTGAERDIARKRLADYRYIAAGDIGEKPVGALANNDPDEDIDVPDADFGSTRPSGGMFGVKLIYPDHLSIPYLCDTYPASDPRKTLMNFRGTARNLKAAQSIPTGHRSLVFTRQHIVWAIEFTGPLDEGSLIAAHGVKPNWPTTEWSGFRPIRFLAKMNVTASSFEHGMHRHEIQARSGVDRRSYGGGHFYISEDEYRRMYEVVPWDWKSNDVGPPQSAALETVVKSAGSAAARFIEPPISDAASLLAQVRDIAGQPERNMEDVVKDLLIRLGHPRSSVRFQVGRIDVSVDGESGKTLFVFEVKRSLANPNTRNDALRKGFDYAHRTAARFVVISDADRYEIYDRMRGLDHASMLCGCFRLTEFKAEDVAILNLLRTRT